MTDCSQIITETFNQKYVEKVEIIATNLIMFPRSIQTSWSAFLEHYQLMVGARSYIQGLLWSSSKFNNGVKDKFSPVAANCVVSRWKHFFCKTICRPIINDPEIISNSKKEWSV